MNYNELIKELNQAKDKIFNNQSYSAMVNINVVLMALIAAESKENAEANQMGKEHAIHQSNKIKELKRLETDKGLPAGTLTSAYTPGTIRSVINDIDDLTGGELSAQGVKR